MTTPAWSAPINGMPGNLDATNSSAGINQFLGAHGVVPVYKGTQILTPAGAQNFLWTAYGNTTDLSQPFTMSGTAIGRVEVPLQPNGNGADVLVSLYADTGGSPNIAAGAVCSTLLPAQYLNQVCAPFGLDSGGPLATPANNTAFIQGGLTTHPYSPPSTSISDTTGSGSACVDNASGYILFAGGQNNTSNGAITNTYTVQNLGGGVLGAPVLQAPLPQGTYAHTMTLVNNSYVVVAGGTIGNLTADTNNVWVASWNAASNQIGSWTGQAALPVTVHAAAGASWGNFVYYLGGITNVGSQGTNTVYVATLNNGQIQSWKQTTSMPYANGVWGAAAWAVNGYLYVIGGQNVSATEYANVYYAKIQSDGTLGTWQSGPSLPTATYNGGIPGRATAQADDLIFMLGSGNASFANEVQVLAVSGLGPGPAWQQTLWSGSNPVGVLQPVVLLQPDGTGNYDLIVVDLDDTPSYYWSTSLTSVPLISVPLPAPGLTNGATYHVVLRQFSSTSASDYVAFGTLDGTPLPSAALTHGRYASGAWTSVGAGRSVPMSVFDQTVGGSVLHTWEDASTVDMAGTAARWSSLLYNAQGLLTGAAEVTTQPNVPLNANPTFTSGVSPWTAVNGTITQSSAQTHGGYAFSGLLTPTGGFTQAYALSELIPVTQTAWGSAQWLLVNGWFYTPTTWSSFDLAVFWFDSGGNFISSSDLNTSLTGATWTQESHYVTPPATTAGARILAILNGSPTASQLLYMSDVQLLLTPETVGALTSAATVNYGSAPFPPTGVTQLN